MDMVIVYGRTYKKLCIKTTSNNNSNNKNTTNNQLTQAY